MSGLITNIIKPREKNLGDGFRVRRVLPFHTQRMVGPFIFFDHFGPVEYAPGEGFDVRPHPHIGLSTVTYLFEGAIRHQDSLGSDLVIEPGAVNWMTAGHGIVHSERTPPAQRAQGQKLHGLQTWVALPKSHEDIAPNFIHHARESLPVLEKNGARIRVLAGTAWGQTSPVSFPWDILYIAIDVEESASLIIPATLAVERAIYIVDGSATLEGETVEAGTMVVAAEGKDIPVAFMPGTKAVICGGAAMDGPRHIEWNFVASDKALIQRASADWQDSEAAGGTNPRFPAVPGDEDDFIPLP